MIIGVAESSYVISSGNVALEATNLGPNTIFYGGSGVFFNSGGIIVGNGQKFWDSVVGNFTMTFCTYAGSSQLVIQEYAGN